MLGKSKCKILKEIRQKIADENDIPYVTRECTHKGDCSGTCPRCESELRYLERELAARQALGKSVAVAALCAGMAMSVSSCTDAGAWGTNGIELGGDPLPPKEIIEPQGMMVPPEEYESEGDVVYVPELAGVMPLPEDRPLAGEPELPPEECVPVTAPEKDG